MSQLQGKLATAKPADRVRRERTRRTRIATDGRKQELLGGLDLVVESLKASEHLADETGVALSVLEEKRSKQAHEISTLEEVIASTRQKVAKFSAELDELQKTEANAIYDLKKSKEALATLKQQHQNATSDAQAEAAKLQAAQNAVRETWQRRNAVRSLNPLTPEQLAGATITGLGLDARYRNEATSEWEKNQKSEAAKKDKSKDNETEVIAVDEGTKRAAIESLYEKRVDAVVNTYVSMFAAPGGAPQDVFSATADQALFLSNDGRFQNWLSPAGGTLLNRVQSIKDAGELADELYLSILCRPATEEERIELETYSGSTDERQKQSVEGSRVGTVVLA